MMVILRVLISTMLTVSGMVAVAYLAKSLEVNKSLIITLSIVTGIFGFIFGIYWTMTYLVKSGFAKTKANTIK